MSEGSEASLASIVDRVKNTPLNKPENEITQAGHLKQIADFARTEEGRSSLSEHVGEIVPCVVNILKEQDKDKTLYIQCVRALGNLSVDHDQNREAIVQAHATEQLVRALEQHKNAEDILFNVCGAIANVVCQNEAAQKSVVEFGAPQALVGVLNGDYELKTMQMCIQAVSNLFELADAKKQFISSGIVSALAKIGSRAAESKDDDFLEEVINILAEVHDSDEFITQGGSAFLLSLVDKQNPLNTVSSIRVLRKIAGKAELAQQVKERSLLPVFLSFLPWITNDSSTDTGAVAVLTGEFLVYFLGTTHGAELLLSVSDKELANLSSLAGSSSSNRTRLQLLCIVDGVSRTHELTSRILNVPFILPFIINSMASEDNKTTFVSLSALRNLVVTFKDKQFFGKSSVLSRAVAMLLERRKGSQEEIEPIHFHLIVILRNLVKDCQENMEQLIRAFASEHLQKLFELSKSKHVSLHFETIRLVSSIAKNHRSHSVLFKDDANISNSKPIAEEKSTDSKTEESSVPQTVMGLILSMFDSKFDVLKMEMLDTLSSIAAVNVDLIPSDHFIGTVFHKLHKANEYTVFASMCELASMFSDVDSAAYQAS